MVCEGNTTLFIGSHTHCVAHQGIDRPSSAPPLWLWCRPSASSRKRVWFFDNSLLSAVLAGAGLRRKQVRSCSQETQWGHVCRRSAFIPGPRPTWWSSLSWPGGTRREGHEDAVQARSGKITTRTRGRRLPCRDLAIEKAQAFYIRCGAGTACEASRALNHRRDLTGNFELLVQSVRRPACSDLTGQRWRKTH